jgi:phosphoenolpyruvate carboxykinase (ATP)
MCGLSGTGKTALALHKEFKLIGDEELCWGPEGLFGVEGGCYAKTISLNEESEPEIYRAMKFGTILENVSFYPGTRDVNYNDASLTQNTRGSFPLSYLPNVKFPAIGDHPNNIIFLTCDTKGVLPPVAMLDNEQAVFQFLSGYTAKIGGTDLSSKGPESTFSACFGEIFLPLDPVIYAQMFYDKIRAHKAKVWLVNTGYLFNLMQMDQRTVWCRKTNPYLIFREDRQGH